MARGKYTPQLQDEIITRLYHVAQKFQMPMTRILGIIVETALTELEQVNPDDFEIAIPARPEDPASTGETSGLHPARTPGHVLLFRHPAPRDESEAVSDLSGVCEPA